MAVLKANILEYPFYANKVRKLKLGERVLLSGKVFTGRDRLHKFLANGGESPVDLKNGCIFHCGPIAVRDKGGGWSIRAAGPTTSSRQDPYMAELIEKHGIRIIIGKGGMGDATRKACKEHGCVYMQAVGGAGALLAQRVSSVEGVYFLKEFGTADALWELITDRLPAVVAIDSRGRSLYERVSRSSRSALSSLLKRRIRFL